MEKQFQIGDIVQVVDASFRCGHYLQKGAIVTIVSIDEYRVNATVQGDATSFRQDESGWRSGIHGRHCQCIGLNQIRHISQVASIRSTYTNPQMPII